MALTCAECNEELKGKAWCRPCASHDMCVDMMSEDEARADLVKRVSDWLDRELMLKDLPRDVVPHLQRLVEDLEAGDA